MDISGNTQKVRKSMKSVFDKIIEKLEEVGKLEISMRGGRCKGKTLALGYTKGIENAIEIVKQGGVRKEIK